MKRLCFIQKAVWLFIGGCLFIAVGGCATSEKASRQSWSDLFEADRHFSVEDKNQDYDSVRLERDYGRLTVLLEKLDVLADEMAKIKRTFALREKPYLTDQNNEEIEFFLFRYLNAQDALWQIADYYRMAGSGDPLRQCERVLRTSQLYESRRRHP